MSLVDGVVKAVYDPNWSNIINVNAVFEVVGDIIDIIDPNDPEIVSVPSIESPNDNSPPIATSPTVATIPNTPTPTIGGATTASGTSTSNNGTVATVPTSTNNPPTNPGSAVASSSTTAVAVENTDFRAVSLVAYDYAKPARKAISTADGIGETLYYVTQKPLSTLSILPANRKTGFTLKINPNLASAKIDKENIKWFANSKEIGAAKGNKKISVDKLEATDYTVRAEAGKPTTIEKQVKVKIVGSEYSSDKVEIEGSAIAKFKKTLNELAQFVGTRVYNRRNKPQGETTNGILCDVSCQNSAQNIESDKNRLYYKEIKNVKKLEIGVKIGYEAPIPGCAIPSIDRMLFGYKIKVALGLYWFVGAQASAEIGMTDTTKEWVENPQLRTFTTTYNDPSNLKIEGIAGLNPKAVLQVPGIEAEASAKSSAKVTLLDYNFKTTKIKSIFNGEGVKLECSPVTKLYFFGFSWSHEWGKYEYTIK